MLLIINCNTDKIIIKARRNYLIEQYEAASHDAATVLADVTQAAGPLNLNVPPITDTAVVELAERVKGLGDGDKDKREMLSKNLVRLYFDALVLIFKLSRRRFAPSCPRLHQLS